MARLWCYTCPINILEKKLDTASSDGHWVIFTLSSLFQTEFLEPFRPSSHLTYAPPFRHHQHKDYVDVETKGNVTCEQPFTIS